jgi:preprotein translocase subunit SecA
VTRLLVTVQVRAQDVEETAPHAEVQNVRYHHADYDEALGQAGRAAAAAAAATKADARGPQGRPQ